MFTIWESERVYVRMPLSPELLAMKGRTFFPDERWIENGQQEIEGELCTVFQVDNPKPKVLPSESANALVVAYVSNDTKWMRRKEIFDGQGARRLVIDWLEVSFEPIPDEIFELPAMFDEISLRTGKPIRKGDS